MRPLLWSDFFKTRDPPLQELDRRMADAHGAILVGSADDRLVSRGEEFGQMRDNVLLEYGLFAGHLGRHRCILLMPDDPRFRIPSDFLGVAGFELYTYATLNAVAKKVPERLQAAFAANGFKPPSLQERCRRLLLLSGWIRSEIVKIRVERPMKSLKEQFGDKIEAVLCFLKEDIDQLGVREDATALEVLVRKSLDEFPHIPDQENIGNQLKEYVRYFLLDPYHHSLTSRTYGDQYREQASEILRYFEVGDPQFIFQEYRHYWTCPWCGPNQGRDCRYYTSKDRPYIPSSWPIRHRHLNLPEDVQCVGEAWFVGAIDMLSHMHRRFIHEFNMTIDSLERWQRNWTLDILNRLGAMEQKVHKQIFGHL
jgi:hypothetical protein